MPYFPAARIGDPIAQIPPAPPTGTVGNPAAMATAAVPGANRPPLMGAGSVRINGLPAAVAGTTVTCAIDAAAVQPNVILPQPRTSGQVLIGGFPAARAGDRTTCQAVLLPSPSAAALPKVLIGG
ncbi:hypothetical protein Asp14428_74960 [Actinoplanes sp. NBRC 14428]|nr:hypothetical protein Asp14428_74960 [Actinoplanes sp. NBRC 14428]